jgi:outer membrane protein TolC
LDRFLTSRLREKRDYAMQLSLRAGQTVFMVATLCFVSMNWCHAEEKAVPPDRIKALLKEREAVAKDIYELLLEKFKQGNGTVGPVHRAKMVWLSARLSLAETKPERLKIYEELVKDAKEWEQEAIRNVEKGVGQQIEALTAKADRVEAELALERAKEEPQEAEKIPAPK